MFVGYGFFTVHFEFIFVVNDVSNININIYVKPTSCIDSNIIKRVFKGFLHRARSICSEKYIKEEETCLIDMFVENGHSKQLLKNLMVEYNNKKNHKNNHEDSTLI